MSKFKNITMNNIHRYSKNQLKKKNIISFEFLDVIYLYMAYFYNLNESLDEIQSQE